MGNFGFNTLLEDLKVQLAQEGVLKGILVEKVAVDTSH
jgi:hypothetical protein